MFEILSEARIRRLNQIITHCEQLINARGQFNNWFGLYEGAPFEVIFKRDATTIGLQVRHHGDVVLRVQWKRGRGDLGHVIQEPGTWSDQLLRVRAFHA